MSSAEARARLVFLLHFVLERPDGAVLRAAIAKNRDVKFVGEPEQSGDMVGVFVREQDGGEIFRRPADAGEAQADLARGKAGIHENAGVGGLDVGAIAGRTAAEDGEFDGHGLKLKRKAESGKRKTSGKLTWLGIAINLLHALLLAKLERGLLLWPGIVVRLNHEFVKKAFCWFSARWVCSARRERVLFLARAGRCCPDMCPRPFYG